MDRSILPGFVSLPLLDESGHAINVQLKMSRHVLQTARDTIAAFRQACIGKRVLQHFIRNDELLYLFGYGC